MGGAVGDSQGNTSLKHECYEDSEKIVPLSQGILIAIDADSG